MTAMDNSFDTHRGRRQGANEIGISLLLRSTSELGVDDVERSLQLALGFGRHVHRRRAAARPRSTFEIIDVLGARRIDKPDR